MDFPARPGRGGRWLLLLLIGPLAGLVGVYVLLAPTRLEFVLTADTLEAVADLGVIHQGRSLPRSAIRGAEEIRLPPGGRRIAGTGRPDLCTGRWHYRDLGEVWMASRCGALAVRVDTPDRPWILSPDDRPALVQALARPGSSGLFPGAPPFRGYPWWTWGILGLVLAVTPLAVWMVWRLKRPMVYRVAGGELEVPAHFAPVRVTLAAATVRPGTLKGALRTAGTSVPGLYLGRFRHEGQRLHVAATEREGFFVEGRVRVFVTPADGPGFLAALREQGARDR